MQRFLNKKTQKGNCKTLCLCVCVFIIIFFMVVRTGFDSNPKIGMDSGPTSPNNKFVESGRKS